MRRYRLTFSAWIPGVGVRRVSAIRTAEDVHAAIATLAADYEDITDLLIEDD